MGSAACVQNAQIENTKEVTGLTLRDFLPGLRPAIQSKSKLKNIICDGRNKIYAHKNFAIKKFNYVYRHNGIVEAVFMASLSHPNIQDIHLVRDIKSGFYIFQPLGIANTYYAVTQPPAFRPNREGLVKWM